MSIMEDMNFKNAYDEAVDDEARDQVLRDFTKRNNITEQKADPTHDNQDAGEADGNAQQIKDTRHVICAAAYILFVIPLFMNRHDALYKFHARQGLALNILEVLSLFVCPVIVTIGAALNSVLIISAASILSYILGAIAISLALIGIFNSFTDRKKTLPIIGGIVPRK